VIADISLRCDIQYECQTGACVHATAFVTDPQGLEDLDDVPQKLRLYQDSTGTGVPEEHTFRVDAFTKGTYFGGDTYGDYFEGEAGAEVRAELCASTWWPAEVVATDKSGHVTAGKIRATVVQ
jgi:hypothetical protein